MSKLLKYYNTVKYMKPRQAVARVVHSFKKKRSIPESVTYKKICKLNLAIECLDCDTDYVARFLPEKVVDGELFLLNNTLKADYTESYRKEISPLLFFNLHYFEYAIALAAMYKQSGDAVYADVFTKLYKQYLFERKKYYSYVISLHIPNILIALELFENGIEEDFKKEIYSELYKQYTYLISHQETHLLGNHYFENLKAIIIASRFFGEDKICDKYLHKFKKLIKEQILPDGMHEELSVMYHRIIVEDLLRVYKTLKTEDKEYSVFFKGVISRMLSCSASLEKGMGKTPFFNDAADGVSKSNRALVVAAEKLLNIELSLIDSFESAGYYKLYDDNIALMFDAGIIGPDYNAGHGQCDCLSFELSIDDKPLFVNAGTYQYQGNMRKYFRSTAAHNTLKLDNREQSECWQEHRVAGRISGVKAKKSENCLEGEYINTSGDLHKRVVKLADKQLSVSDFVKTKNAKTVHSYLHIAPNFEVQPEDGEIVIPDVCNIKAHNCSYTIYSDGELCSYSPGFYVMQKSICIEFVWDADENEHGYIIKF